MKIKDITNALEELAPLSYAEDFDNVGLLVGQFDTEVTGVLVTLDTLETVVEEAIVKNCNLILSFHPIIFSGLKKLNGNNYVERVVIKAVQHNIAIYAIHTALDNSFSGVNAKICDVLGLQNRSILIPQNETLKQLTIEVPNKATERVGNALIAVGASNIQNRDVGMVITFEKHLEKNITNTLMALYPSEQIHYEITALTKTQERIGMGMIGEFKEAMPEKEFLTFVKKSMQTSCIRHSRTIGKSIKKVAVLGGSGSFAIEKAKNAGADAFVSADFKYHEFYKAENQLLILDIGHYESEQFTKNLLVDYLTKKFTNFAIILSDIHTNPIYYL
jgi:dinuclear metal center YbgI/SA1388 family protein